MGGMLDFGPQGDLGAKFDPPIRSIPEFLERLPEVQLAIEALPEEYPGKRIGAGEHVVTVMATGKEKVTPLWRWAMRKPAD
jgi:hypothetical protein